MRFQHAGKPDVIASVDRCSIKVRSDRRRNLATTCRRWCGRGSWSSFALTCATSVDDRLNLWLRKRAVEQFHFVNEAHEVRASAAGADPQGRVVRRTERTGGRARECAVDIKSICRSIEGPGEVGPGV